MSAAASAYYQGRAEAVGIGLAPVLNGDPVTLLEDGRVSLHLPSEGAVDAIAMRCGEVLGAAAVLVTAEARAQHEATGAPLLPVPHPKFVKGTLLSSLAPSGLRTGHFTDISIEALARSEVDEQILAALTPSVRERIVRALGDATCEPRQVYLLSTGVFKASGRAPIRTGAFTLVKAEQDSLVPKYCTVSLGRNALLGSSLFREARATSEAVGSNQARHASPSAMGNTR